jgi:hypothetical protein
MYGKLKELTMPSQGATGAMTLLSETDATSTREIRTLRLEASIDGSVVVLTDMRTEFNQRSSFQSSDQSADRKSIRVGELKVATPLRTPRLAREGGPPKIVCDRLELLAALCRSVVHWNCANARSCRAGRVLPTRPTVSQSRAARLSPCLNARLSAHGTNTEQHQLSSRHGERVVNQFPSSASSWRTAPIV